MKTYNCFLLLTFLAQMNLFFGCNNRQAEQQANTELGNRDSVVVGIMGDHLKAVWHSLDLIDTRLKDVERQEATVTTEEESYSVAKNQFGAFPIVSKSVFPYMDGYKVKLMIGNPTTATFHGANVKVTWGPPYEQNSNWSPLSQRSQVFNLTSRFSPGKYTTVELALTPAKADEIKKIFVDVQFNQLSLAQ